MFSFAGVVKILKDNNMSLWTFDEAAPSVGRSEDAAAESAQQHLPEDQDDLEPLTGRERWLKGRSGSESTDSVTSRQERSSSINDCGVEKPPLVPVKIVDLIENTGRELADAINLSEIPSAAKKNKKRKKPRSRANSSSSAVSSKSVSFGDVDEVQFSMTFAFDRVPSDGSYPLGLGEEVGRRNFSVDERTSMQQAELIQRAIDLGISLEHMTIDGPDGPQLSPLESRQFDYKNGKNQLFSRLSEEDRCVLFYEVNRCCALKLLSLVTQDCFDWYCKD